MSLGEAAVCRATLPFEALCYAVMRPGFRVYPGPNSIGDPASGLYALSPSWVFDRVRSWRTRSAARVCRSGERSPWGTSGRSSATGACGETVIADLMPVALRPPLRDFEYSSRAQLTLTCSSAPARPRLPTCESCWPASVTHSRRWTQSLTSAAAVAESRVGSQTSPGPSSTAVTTTPSSSTGVTRISAS